jgi:hypothetical protein
MQLACPACSRVLEYSGERPRFCAWCGQALPDARPPDTAAYTPAEDSLASPPASAVAETRVAATQADAAEPVPQTVGSYRLVRRLGKGGMGTVFEAEEATTGQHVALKLIRADCVASQEAIERFRQEGRLASLVAHPRCVFVLAADEEAGRPYIVMELMPGQTLHDLVHKQGPLPPEQAVAKILDVIDGLLEAHELGVIHRDVKPSNCFLDAEGRVKVGDFGLSKSLVGGTQLTRTGAFLGTPLYASPEQIRSQPVDQQGDVYSVAATLYFLLVGRAPFQGGDAAATLARIVADDPPPLRSHDRSLARTLDEIVLKGLERDRAKRWRNLEELRSALLPFVPGRHSISEIGFRVGAGLFDLLLLTGGDLLFSLALSGLGLASARSDPAVLLTLSIAFGFLLRLAYFGVPEGLWGWSLGKLAFGLRVRRVSNNDVPGLARAVWRAGVFCLLLRLGLLAWLFVHGGQVWQHALHYRTVTELFLDLSFLPLAGWAVGLLLTAAPMRRRNGYRGLHEWLSGTHVIRLPRPRPPRTFGGKGLALPAVPVPGLPERLGPFEIRGALPETAGERVLLGEDPSLNRRAWIWLRPGDERPVSPARRKVSRVTRARWLATGQQDGPEWDAFLAPTGCPLPGLVDRRRRLGWPEARHVLEQLTEELAAARADGTLPETLTAEQVWVSPHGRVQLVDSFSPGRASAPASNATALGLLREVAVLLLEGQRRSPKDTHPAVRAPVPEHAARMLARLLGARGGYQTVEQFRTDLELTGERPEEVSRPRRRTQLAILAGLLLPGLLTMVLATLLYPLGNAAVLYVPLHDGELALQDFGATALANVLAAGTSPTPFGRLAAVAQRQVDVPAEAVLAAEVEEMRRQRDVYLRSSSWLTRLDARRIDAWTRAVSPPRRFLLTPYGFREAARQVGDRKPMPIQDGRHIRGVLLLLLAVWPGLWVLWAFVTRGGVVLRLAGTSLVRAGGRRASRLRCAWRALVVWLPVTALWAAVIWLDTSFLNPWAPPPTGLLAGWAPWLSWALWWLALLLVPAYLALALVNPARSLHDRLAGTYLVPR